MRPHTTAGWVALVLGVLLVVSNGWWLYTTIDNAVTDSYRQHELAKSRQTLDQALRLMPALEPAIDKGQLVAAAERLSSEESFEKDGCTWVGNLGLRFDAGGKLIHVTTTWNSGNEDPCFPD